VQSGCAVESGHGGYWVAAADGGVFSYGGAPFYGSLGNVHLNLDPPTGSGFGG
jgi:hypothetical protein